MSSEKKDDNKQEQDFAELEAEHTQTIAPKGILSAERISHTNPDEKDAARIEATLSKDVLDGLVREIGDRYRIAERKPRKSCAS